MSVVSVSLKVAGRVGAFSSERKGSVFEMTNRAYRKIYLVTTNSILDGPTTILNNAGSGFSDPLRVPQIGDVYTVGNDVDGLATCTKTSCDPTEHPNYWTVTAEYNTDRVIDAALSNPLNLPAEISWDNAAYDRVLVRDLLGVPIVNSSGEPFDPPLTTEDSRPTLTITRNEAVAPGANAIAYQDAVNADVFGPALFRQAKIRNITSNKQQDIGIVYYRVTYTIEFRRETFDLFVLDQGYRDVNKNLFRDVRTQAPMGSPTLLNGRGQRRTDAVSLLAAACGINDTTISIGVVDATNLFPPLASNPIGLVPPPHWYFEVLIDSEIMQIYNSNGAGVWNVTRGYGGTIPAAHNVGATVALQPYYLRYLPSKILYFAPLNLPTS